VAFEISSLRGESKTWDSVVCVRCSLCLVDVKIRDDKSLLFRTWKESVRGARRAHADGNAKWGAERRLIQLRWLRKVVSFARNWRRSRSIGHFTSLIIGADTAPLYSSIIILSMRPCATFLALSYFIRAARSFLTCTFDKLSSCWIAVTFINFSWRGTYANVQRSLISRSKTNGMLQWETRRFRASRAESP